MQKVGRRHFLKTELKPRMEPQALLRLPEKP